jgi:hypothetical protein
VDSEHEINAHLRLAYQSEQELSALSEEDEQSVAIDVTVQVRPDENERYSDWDIEDYADIEDLHFRFFLIIIFGDDEFEIDMESLDADCGEEDENSEWQAIEEELSFRLYFLHDWGPEEQYNIPLISMHDAVTSGDDEVSEFSLGLDDTDGGDILASISLTPDWNGDEWDPFFIRANVIYDEEDGFKDWANFFTWREKATLKWKPNTAATERSIREENLVASPPKLQSQPTKTNLAEADDKFAKARTQSLTDWLADYEAATPRGSLARR